MEHGSAVFELAIQIAGEFAHFSAIDLGRLEQVCRDESLFQPLWERLCRQRWVIPKKAGLIFGDGEIVIWKLRFKQARWWDGRLFASGLWGPSGQSYQFCSPENEHPKERFPTLRFSSAACGELHFIAIAGESPLPATHHVFAWGHYRLTPTDLASGAPGTRAGEACRAPCGLPRGEVNAEPTRVDRYDDADGLYLVAKQAHTRLGRSAVVSEGNLLTFGASSNGLGLWNDNWTERYVPLVVSLPVPGAVRVACVSLGDHHTLLADTAGRLYAFGESAHGRLGLGAAIAAMEPVKTPAQVTSLAEQRVVCVAAGDRHSLALTDDGAVWAFGSNRRCQLGVPAASVVAYSPVRVGQPTSTLDIDMPVVAHVAAGANLSAALTSDGSLLTFGQGNENGLGTGSRMDEHKPTAVMPGQCFVSVSVGAGYMVAIDDEARAFSWGYNPFNQCGRGYRRGHDPHQCPDGDVDVGQVQLPGPVRFVSACFATFYVLGLQHN